MTSTYDAIVLGAGHNGLILQAYLGKAGMKTLALERRAVAGGGLSTIEDPRHFLHNTHAFSCAPSPPCRGTRILSSHATARS
jgi:phytoene dehydrogenase-like protein